MTSEQATALNDLAGAIGWLKEARSILSRIPGYGDWCRDSKGAIANAEASYKVIASQLR